MGFTYIRFSKAMLVSATDFISKEVKHHTVEHLLILVPTKNSIQNFDFLTTSNSKKINWGSIINQN
jgi:hypothetical protein